VTCISRGNDFGVKMVARPVRGAEEGVLATDWKDAERGLGLGTGGKSNDSRVGVETVVVGLRCMGVGGGISEGGNSGGIGGTGTEVRPRMR